MEVLTVSINDTARALGLGRTSIYLMIADGRLEALKLGRRTLILSESIRRLVAEHGGTFPIPNAPVRQRALPGLRPAVNDQ